jgi:hypothetical protein
MGANSALPLMDKPRFVVLRHETPPNFPRGLHWDLMLEQDGVLRTWALAEEPNPRKTILAEELAVHRMAYLQYEGPVAGDRGTVTRWDEGEFSIAQETADAIDLELSGRRLVGKVKLNRRPEDPVQWTFRWEDD